MWRCNEPPNLEYETGENEINTMSQSRKYKDKKDMAQISYVNWWKRLTSSKINTKRQTREGSKDV